MPFSKYFNSITLRLVLLFVTTGILILFVFSLTSSISLNNLIETKVRPNFIHYANYIVKEIGSPPSIEKAKKLSRELSIGVAINGKDIHWHSTRKPIDFAKIQFLQPQLDINQTNLHSALYNDIFAVWVRSGNYDIVLIMDRNLQSKYDWGSIIGISIIMALLTFLFLFIYWLFKALRALQEDVHRIGSGDLSHRINIKRTDDLGNLAKAFNSMADDIQNMLEAKRQMLLAISHELRSPLTRSKLALAVMPESPQRDSISFDIDEMEAMISELLEAERLNAKHEALHLQAHNLNDIITTIVSEFFADENIQLQLDETFLPQPLDLARLRFVIKNILENALKYQGDKSKVVLVKTKQNKHHTMLNITDYGVGITAEHIPRLTEPFYRVDPSRQRKTGGFGLGLYLCKLIAEAHKGTLQIESELGKGTSISVTFPQRANYP